MSEVEITCVVNGVTVTKSVEPRMSLADFLRHTLHLTGTHVGCEHGVCGACTVMVEGKAVRGCLMFAVQANGKSIGTVEGLAENGELSPLQAAFQRNHALQCGFCTPGILNTAHAFLTSEPNPTAEQIREVISGNICRCTGYEGIIDAILEASSHYWEKSSNADR